MNLRAVLITSGLVLGVALKAYKLYSEYQRIQYYQSLRGREYTPPTKPDHWPNSN